MPVASWRGTAHTVLCVYTVHVDIASGKLVHRYIPFGTLRKYNDCYQSAKTPREKSTLQYILTLLRKKRLCKQSDSGE